MSPPIASPTWHELESYCRGQGLDPRQAPWIWEPRHLNGVSGPVVLIVSRAPFPAGFLDLLLSRERDGLIEVERVCLDSRGSRSSLPVSNLHIARRGTRRARAA